MSEICGGRGYEAGAGKDRRTSRQCAYMVVCLDVLNA